MEGKWEPKFMNGPNMDFTEDMEDYKPGGYHPILLDDMLADRFEVIHKLGYGGIATVWLCMDHQKKEWCAVKVLAASCSSEDGSDLKVMRRFRERGIGPQDAAAAGIVLPSEHFWIDGPNGRHLCLVLPVLGVTLSDWYDWNQTSHAAIKSICRQLAKGMLFLHRQGICHGDFRPSNILMKVKGLNHLDKDQIIDLFGGQNADAVETYSGEDPGPSAPEYVVVPGSWDTLREKGLVTDDIAIVDFGEAYDPSSPPDFLGIPEGFAAPEVVFGGKPGFGTDIWALICTFLSLEGVQFFDGTTWDIASELELHLGPLPEAYRAPFQQKWYEYQLARYRNAVSPTGSPPKKISLPKSGQPLEPVTRSAKELVEERKTQSENTGYPDPFTAYIGRERVRYHRPLDGPFERNDYALPKDEALRLADLARKVFRYDISERITIPEILDHPWLNPGAGFRGRTILAPFQDFVTSIWVWCVYICFPTTVRFGVFLVSLLNVVFRLMGLYVCWRFLAWCWHAVVA